MNANWSSGYASDIAYTVGFYRELAPLWLRYVAVSNGIAVQPEGEYRYCELGCGRGYATVLLAAANPGSHFVGIDFNPTHIAEARALAAEAGIQNVSFHEMGFGEAAASSAPELGEFDFVTMHGVYSWVVPAVQEEIHAFLRAKLVPGGIFYMSYNTQPGWSAVGPVQHLLQEVAARSSGDSLARLGKGYELLTRLSDKNAAFIVQNQTVKNRVDAMKTQDRHYLVHEFLHSGWRPLYVTEAMASLGAAKLVYAGSANTVENRIALAVAGDHQPLVREAPDVAMRELLKDYAVNKQFRKDVYVKGARRLTGAEQKRQLDAMHFSRINSMQPVPKAYKVPAGEAKPNQKLLAAVTGSLAEPRPVADLVAAAEKAGSKRADVYMLLDLLVHHSVVHPARADHASMDNSAVDRLNALIVERAVASDTHRCLAAPIIGSAIGLDRLQMLLLPLLRLGAGTNDEEIGGKALEKFRAAGLSLTRDGTRDLPQDDAEALSQVAAEVAEHRLPDWRRLRAVPRD